MRDEVQEILHDSCPVACMGDAPADTSIIHSHVNVGFFHGAGCLIRPACCKAPAVHAPCEGETGRGATDAASLGRLIETAYWT
jgi:hypothetical protein